MKLKSTQDNNEMEQKIINFDIFYKEAVQEMRKAIEEKENNVLEKQQAFEKEMEPKIEQFMQLDARMKRLITFNQVMDKRVGGQDELLKKHSEVIKATEVLPKQFL